MKIKQKIEKNTRQSEYKKSFSFNANLTGVSDNTQEINCNQVVSSQKLADKNNITTQKRRFIKELQGYQ